MRTKRNAMGLFGLLMTGAAIHVGCGSLYEDFYEPLTDPNLGTDGGGGGGIPEGCVPSLNEEAAGDACGVFVATSGNDGGVGTKSEPLKTVGAAIMRAQENGTRRVYACAETFEEPVEVPGGVTVFGGLDCANGWGWIGETTRTTVTAAQGVTPLRMTGGEGAVHIEDVEAVARSIDATAMPDLLGASSIAAVANGGSVELVRCALIAGDAADGEVGVPGAPRDMNGEVTPAAVGQVGNPGGDACTASQVVGGEPPLNDCGTPMDTTDDSIGGGGGTGTLASGQPGSYGLPVSADNGGTGESVSQCSDGNPGDLGAAGDPGAGATGLGTISVSGYAGVSGGEGFKGAPGQGGGGGGGAKGGTAMDQCSNAMMAGGASGGSGASGGCGGLGGKGGGPGGSSIALISLNAALVFDTVTLRTGRGGSGGPGGEPQPGGLGGANGGAAGSKGGASALNDACAGGPGGKGGNGGLGGGGLGGHSIGIAYQGTAPPAEGVTIETGDAGPGGTGADEQHNGAAGVKASVQTFQP